jgi:hypothetical protein
MAQKHKHAGAADLDGATHTTTRRRVRCVPARTVNKTEKRDVGIRDSYSRRDEKYEHEREKIKGTMFIYIMGMFGAVADRNETKGKTKQMVGLFHPPPLRSRLTPVRLRCG